MYGATTLQFRLSLSIVEAGVEVSQKVILARRSDEALTHVVLRLLSYCLFYRGEGSEALRFAVGPADRDGPDLCASNLIGEPVEWIICGAIEAEELRHVLQHQRQAQVRILFGSEAEVATFSHSITALRKRMLGLDKVKMYQLDEALVAGLAEAAMERQRWTVTVLEDHLYVDADGVTGDSAISRPRIALPEA